MADSFLHGCNYPWSTDGVTVFYGLDFGGNVWGSHLGVSTRRHAVAADFARMAALGFRLVRWFLFCDGRSGIVFGEDGMPAGIDAYLFADVDAALEIAGEVGIGIDFVLLDHHWMFKGRQALVSDPTTGATFEARLPEGRAEVLLSPRGRDALFTQVIEPLVQRYAPGGDRADLAGAVAAYELMNEPDFVIEEWERDLSPRVRRPLPFEVVAELVGDLSDLVHRRSTAFTTLGCARTDNLWAWDSDDLGLDVLQLHSYPDLRRRGSDRDILGVPASALGVRRGVILGEFPGDAVHQHPAGAAPPDTTLEQYLEFALMFGYRGAWPWSFSGTDAYGRLPEAPLREFAARYPELVNPRARS